MNVPYIITTIKGYAIERYGIDVARQTDSKRHAVATLDEARAVARAAIPSGQPSHGARGDAEQLPRSGGTITLPDGTVIEVERVSKADMRVLVHSMRPPVDVCPKSLAWIIDAYNAD